MPFLLLLGLASAGAAETLYLAYEKLTGGSVFCPLDGCGDVLSSQWGSLLGVPLSLYGFAGYTAIAVAAQVARSSQNLSTTQDLLRWFILGTATAMASVSAYLMYILTSQLSGAACLFCYSSAVLSCCLLLASFKGFTGGEIRKAIGPQLAVSAAVLFGLSVAFSDARSALAGTSDIDLPPVEPEITVASAAKEISLAKHLKAVGAKMYGAFWCSHCFEQKQMFGREAMKIVDYVECYPQGYRRGVEIAKACSDVNIEGFPTWIIKGQQYSGEQDLEQLAKLSGFDLSKLQKQIVPAP